MKPPWKPWSSLKSAQWNWSMVALNWMQWRILGLDLSRSKMPICPVLQESSHWKEAILPGGGARSSMHGSKHFQTFSPSRKYLPMGFSCPWCYQKTISWIGQMGWVDHFMSPYDGKTTSSMQSSWSQERLLFYFLSLHTTWHFYQSIRGTNCCKLSENFPFSSFSALALHLNNLAVTSCKDLFHSDGVLPRQSCNLTNIVIMDSRTTWAFLPILFSPGFASKIDSSHWLFGKKKKDVRKIISCAL